MARTAVTPTVQRDIPYQRTPCPVYKLGEFLRRGVSHAAGTGLALVSRWWAIVLRIICFFYVLLFSLLPLHIIITITTTTILLILYFTLFQLLNCSYFSPWLLLFSWFSCPFHWVGVKPQRGIIWHQRGGAQIGTAHGRFCSWVSVVSSQQRILLLTYPALDFSGRLSSSCSSHSCCSLCEKSGSLPGSWQGIGMLAIAMLQLQASRATL